MLIYRAQILRAFVLAGCAAFPAIASADDLYVSTNGSFTATPTNPGVTIVRIADGMLVYRTAANTERSVKAADVLYIRAVNDAPFDAAEQAFNGGDFDKAADGYLRILREGGDGWKQRRAAARLAVAAAKTNRFEAALAAYVAQAKFDPAAATKPKLPARGSRYLDDAIKLLEPASRAATNDAERSALLSLLVDVQLAKGDQVAAATSTDRLAAAAPTTPGGAADTTAAAEARLAQARSALASGQIEKVASIIESAAPLLAAAPQQAEALALIARGKSAAADASKDPAARRDAAIAWLRLIAHFGSTPAGEPYFAEAMLAAAQQQAAAGDVEAARSLYGQLIAERAGSPAATLAAERVARLPAAPTR